MKIKGCDVNLNQKKVNWSGAKADGIIWSGIRWGQRHGTDGWTDPQVKANWSGAKEQRIFRFGFWVWDEREDDDARSHMDGLLAVARLLADDGQYHGELPFNVDVELEPLDWDELHAFLIMIENWSGRRPTIYSGSWFFERVDPLPDWLSDYDLWLTGYNDEGPDIWGPIAEINPNVVCWQQADDWQVSWTQSGTVSRDYWIKDFWRYLMTKVINYDALLSWLADNAFECDDQPIPPPSTDRLVLASPLPEPLSQHRMSQDFALHPDWSAYASIKGHDGIDWAVPEGTPIMASHDGIVTVAGIRFDGDPYGDHVRIEADAKDHLGIEKHFTTIYGHLLDVDVSKGQQVEKGQLIGLSGGLTGRPGNSTGPHIHFGLKCDGATGLYTLLNYDFVNPWVYGLDPACGTTVIERRRIKDGVWLNCRHLPSTTTGLVRKVLSPRTELNIYQISNGWGCLDVSRTGWLSLHPNYSEVIE